MKLIRYHTSEGHRMAVIAKTGRKYIYLAIVGEPRLKRVSKAEARFFTYLGEPTRKQIRIFNRSARAAGWNKRRSLL